MRKVMIAEIDERTRKRFKKLCHRQGIPLRVGLESLMCYAIENGIRFNVGVERPVKEGVFVTNGN